MIDLKLSPVFEKNWDAIHEVDHTGKRRWRYIVNKGSSRSSKTYSLIDIYDMYARINKNKRMTLWRETKIDCKRTVLDDALRHHKNTNRYENGYKFNKTESIFNYKRGSTVEVHGADDANKVHGLTQDCAWLNEPYNISRSVFDQIDQRTSEFVIMDYNPKMAHFIDDLIKDPRTIVIKSTFRDNPFCPDEQRKKILSYQPIAACAIVTSKRMTEEEARHYNSTLNLICFTDLEINELERCKFNQSIGTANAYNWSVYGLGEKAERPNRIYRWKEMSSYEFDQLDYQDYYGCDWGAVDPWGIVKIKYNDNRLFIKQLNYESENIIKAKMTNSERQQISEGDEGIVSWMFNRLGIGYDKTIVCDNNRPDKIRALRSAGWDYAIAATKGPGSILDSIDLIGSLDVYMTSDSADLKYEQENYSRDQDRHGNILENAIDLNNHLIDPTHYVGQYLRSEGIINKV